VTTATLQDHLTAQGGSATELYSRGARVQKRAADPPTGATTFVAVRVEPTADPTPPARGPLFRISCGAHTVEFTEWPQAPWLAALLGALPGPAQ